VEGHFSNHLRIGHNGYEFIFEFAQCNVGEDGMVHTRIITAPVYAKAFLEVCHRLGNVADESKASQR